MNALTILKKLDEEEQLIGGWCSVSLDEAGELVIDHHGDTIQPHELKKAMVNYMLKYAVVGEDHIAFENKGKVVECLYLDEEKAEAMGVDISKTYKAAAWITIKVLDQDLWKKVKNDNYLSFSIGGKADQV